MTQTANSSFLHGAQVRANGIRQHILRYGGRGDPLLVIPGITSPAATWGFVGERLGRHYDTYVIDTRGRGLSETPADADYSLDAYAGDAAGLADALGLRRFHLLGHSMGGRIAARAASRHADRLRRLILVDPPLSGPGRRQYVRSLQFYIDSIREARSGRLTIDSVRRTYPKWTDEQLWQRVEWLHTCDEKAIEASLRSFNDEDIHADLAALSIPTLLMAAGQGGVILDADIAELQTLAPSIRVARIDHCGHLIPFDDLEIFIDTAVDFLGRDE